MAPKNNNWKDCSFGEIEMLSKLLADEFLLALKTNNAKGSRTKKLFFQKQHKELKRITDRIAGYIATQQSAMTIPGDYIKLLLSEHENIIINYRESCSHIASALHKESVIFVTSILESHEKMAWALRTQLK